MLKKGKREKLSYKSERNAEEKENKNMFLTSKYSAQDA